MTSTIVGVKQLMVFLGSFGRPGRETIAISQAPKLIRELMHHFQAEAVIWVASYLRPADDAHEESAKESTIQKHCS